MSPALLIDGYKIDHRRQYDPNITLVFSNLTARKTRRGVDKVGMFGLQYFIKKYLIEEWNANFFSKGKDEVSADFTNRINAYLGPNSIGSEHLKELHDLGYLPICIYALPEGTMHGIKIPSVVFWSTNKKFAWFTNYIETIFSTTIWGPSTSMTTAFYFRQLLESFARETVGDTSFVQWQGHDFSFRGMFGLEAACMSGGAHLIAFTGSDTIPAVEWLEKYYNADYQSELIAGSVAATEHSVACSTILNFVDKIRVEKTANGERVIEDELMELADIEYVRHLIQDIYPTGIVSIVADSFDYWTTITKTARALKDIIMARNGTVTFRPDTGDPVKIVCGYKWTDIDNLDKASESLFFDYEVIKFKGVFYSHLGEVLPEHEVKGSIECLWDIFGGTVSEQGYKVLDSHVKLIYGDSITYERCRDICQGLKNKGFASTNIVFGVGSFTYQYVTRDTDGYAVKATYCEVNGKPLNIYKAPKTDDGTKKSATGLLAVYEKDGEFTLKERATWEEVKNCAFVPIFDSGTLLKDWTLAEVRATLAKYL